MTEPEASSPDQAPTTATPLTGEEGGLWRVHTIGSLHSFDLDAGTVERLPGAGAAVIDFPGSHPLLEIIHCTVGAGGYWAIESDDPRFSYLAHTSSTISHIERVERDS
ncbi:hypothetical protein BKA04_001348 [Cryobacterium mesophilum]|jgi:hypothetical protein|uniref:Uncharacterized protein n=1 Tax=Terrimesophilobacter mesophilus TaxID=433647 RepID=A0A4R8VCQ3_9MICO|nr:hypothetical protein [Terrimesophilobacter mesophilus]MBB5633125.1 hypothetical protein [Terrimesophilobacter mesophilus]TFB79882.1 hypothetical protein E3N84_07395 [Terrimesophilobacter mesophilus]